MDKILPAGASIEELRKECDILDTDLKLLNNNLKALTGKRVGSLVTGGKKDIKSELNERTFKANEDLNRGVKRRDLSDLSDSNSLDESPKVNHSVKLLSVLVKPDNKKDLASETKRRALLESQRKDERVFDRNKRMFGMLLGTLKSFKTEETDRERLTIKRSKIEEKLDLAVEEERATVTKEVHKIIEEKQQKEELLDKAELKLDILSSFKNWEHTHKHLCKYIQTEAKPKLFWLPKEHTQFTERRLKETRDYFSLCVAERTAKLKKELDDLDNNDHNQKGSLHMQLPEVTDNRSKDSMSPSTSGRSSN